MSELWILNEMRPSRAGIQTNPRIVKGKSTLQAESAGGAINHLKITGGMGTRQESEGRNCR